MQWPRLWITLCLLSPNSYGLHFACCFVLSVLLQSVLLLPLPPCVFSQWAFLLSSSHGWRGTAALRLPAINQLYIPTLDFSSLSEYPASLVIHVYSCYFWVSRDSILFVVFIVSSLYLFRLCAVPQSALPLPSSSALLGIVDSSVFVLTLFLFYPSVFTLFFVKRRAHSPFPLFFIFCVLLPVCSRTIWVWILFSINKCFV